MQTVSGFRLGTGLVPSTGRRPCQAWEGRARFFRTDLTVTPPSSSPSDLPLSSFCSPAGCYTVLPEPEGVQSFILSLAYCMEAVIFRALAPATSSHLTDLLILVILSCALASILEVIFDNKLVKFCRTFFTTLQVTIRTILQSTF